MPNAKLYSIVIARLVWVAVLLVLRWIAYVPYCAGVILQTLFETVIDGSTAWIQQTTQRNNELLNK